MSEADTEDVETEAEADEQPEDAAEPEDDRPGIDEEEKADLDAIREEVANETAPEDDEEGDTAASEDDVGATEADSSDLAGGEDTVGDFYVDTLVSTSNLLIEEHGREGADPIDGGMLRQMGVDDAVDELLAENGQPDMPPEQQVLLGTTVFAVAVLATRTTVFDQALENSNLDLLD